ncbi:MAG: antibiotic biosynthesis monooxygenase family protein [Prochlorotrichaceae cyanobacterium]|jgi:heme-degrading monooxygenase HmoA
MSDFQDFLKRDYAHITMGEFKPGKFAEAEKLYEEAVAAYGSGFKAAYLFQDPDSNRGISVILWDSLEHLTQENQDEVHQAIFKKMAPLFTQLPEAKVYEVVYEKQQGTEAV